MQEDMIVQSRTFDLLAWLIPVSNKFPKIYRFTVTQRMTMAALLFQENLVSAQTTQGRERRKQLSQCDANLGQLRVYLRLAHHWRWLSDGQYHHVSHMIAEIGRLLGGWIRSSEYKKSTPALR